MGDTVEQTGKVQDDSKKKNKKRLVVNKHDFAQNIVLPLLVMMVPNE